MVFHKVWSV